MNAVLDMQEEDSDAIMMGDGIKLGGVYKNYETKVSYDPEHFELSWIEALAGATRDENDSIRQEAARSLGTLHVGEEYAVPALIACVEEENKAGTVFSGLREAAVFSLGMFGQRAVSAIPALVETGKLDAITPDFIFTLHMLGPAFCPVLVELMRKHTDPELLQMAGEILIDFGEKSGPALLEISKVDNVTAQLKAVEIMAVLQLQLPENLMEILRASVGDPDVEVRIRGVDILGCFVSESKEAREILLSAKKDASRKVRSKIKRALK